MSGLAVEFDPMLAGQTVNRVRDALSRSETACVSQVLEVIQEMSDKADRLSVQDLADIIGRDLTTVAKIMRAANCLGYNPGAVDVTTLTEAINVIGFERIRNLAISLLLIENAEARTDAKETRDVAAVALSSALLSQVIVQRTTAINADQAFVCAALRHYGKLLFSTFLPDNYRAALELTRETSLDAACKLVFGLTPLDLSRQILSESHLPRVIAHALRDAGPELLRSERLSDLDRLQVIAEFASKVCELVEKPEMTTADYESGLAHLIKTYSNSVSVTSKDLKGLLAEVDQMLGTVGRAQGLDSLSSPLMNRIRCLAEGRNFASIPAPIRAGTSGGSAAAETRSSDSLASGLLEVRRLMEATPPDPRRIFAVAARAIKDGLGLRSCLVFLKEETGPMYAARIGSGASFEAIRNQPVLDPHQKDVFTVCLARGEDALIQNPDEPKIAPFIPDWFKRLPGRGSFVLLPVKDGGGTFAIICGMAGQNDRIELNATRLQQLKTLRSHLAVLRDSLEHLRAAA